VEEEEEIQEKIKDKKEDIKNKETKEKKESPLEEAEPEIAAFLQEKLYEKLGWSFEENEKKLDSIDSIVDYLQELVSENSKPIYANEEIEKLNDYVSNGGDISKYFSSKYSGGLNLDNLVVDSKIDQELVLREYFKTQGYSEDKIKKRIERYDATGVLEDEAEDALEYLKKYRQKETDKILIDQQKLQQEVEHQRLNFYNETVAEIDKTKNILGIPLTLAEQTKLKNYIFKAESDGQTKFQKDYAKTHKNLIMSAFLVMMGDKLSEKVTKQASSEATKNLKTKLETIKNSKRTKHSGNAIDEEYSKPLDRFSSLLSKPVY
jgi:hypothetical protein